MSAIQAGTCAVTTSASIPLLGDCRPELEQRWNAVLQNGQSMRIRQTRKQDAELQRRFIEELPRNSHRFRFLGTMRKPNEDLLQQHHDFEEGSAITLLASTGQGAEEKAIGAGRFNTGSGRACRFSVLVSKAWQERGVGTLIMQHLICTAIDRGILSMHSVDATDDAAVRALADQLGFKRAAIPNDASRVFYSLDLARRHTDADSLRA